jgi:iron complex outermembrane receptor protein
MDNGKPIRESRDVDVPIAAAHFFYHAGWADKLEFAGFGNNPQSLGVAAQIIPWNFPLLMLAWKIAPALATGNTVVLKPAETTPLTALLFAEICQQADLPPGVVNILTRAPDVPPPVLNFGPQQEDNVRQWTGGIAYEGRWAGVGELSVGVQKSDYSKRIGFPGAINGIDASPWLYNVTAAVQISDSISLYGGAVTGLEESGVAPNFAANRNEALPAIQTSQIDAGVRVNLGGSMRLVAGLFKVSKPYFNLDANSRFDVLGDVINRGVEASIAGPITPELSVVMGAVLLRPEVTGDAVARGLVGRLPVGAISERVEFSADWRPGFAPGLSLDMRLSYRSPEVATVNNLVFVPTRTLIDLGGRYRFKLAGNEAVLRVQATNVTSQQGFELRGANAYTVLPGRVTQAYLTVDF